MTRFFFEIKLIYERRKNCEKISKEQNNNLFTNIVIKKKREKNNL